MAELGILLYNAIKPAKEVAGNISKTVSEVNQMITDVHAYTSSQIKNLESQQRSINASIQAAAVFNGTGRLINKTTIPRVNKTLDSLTESLNSLNVMVKDTNIAVNTKLLPQMTETIKVYGVTAEKLNEAIFKISKETSLTIQEIRAIIASDEWKKILENISSVTEHMDGISENIEETTDKMPSMAALVEKMMKTTSKYQKALILSQIFSFILRAF
jgi:hypothetical protein